MRWGRLGRSTSSSTAGPGEHLHVEETDAVIGQAHAGRRQVALHDQMREVALKIGVVQGIGRTPGELGEIAHHGEIALVGARGEAAHAHGGDHVLTQGGHLLVLGNDPEWASFSVDDQRKRAENDNEANGRGTPSRIAAPFAFR